jgi:predicted NAD/FAD-binding protein
MKVAVIGTGIAGNVAAYHLAQKHDITVYEANSHIGGHTHTHDIDWEGKRYAIDTGFIVFNYWTYPNFTRLLEELGVEVQASNMSFSVKCEKTGLEYNGTSLNSLFAQRRNFLKPSFYRMIGDILRFNREAPKLLQTDGEEISLGDYLQEGGYGRAFIEHYIVPMGSAIWSADPAQMHKFPARFFIRFFHNHGMLNVDDRPTWYVIKGGSREYVEKLIDGYRDRIRLNSRVISVKRLDGHVEIKTAEQPAEKFDYVFIAGHSDQALKMLTDPTQAEREILGAIPYQKNEAILHADASLLPKRRLAWAAWNYHVLPEYQGRAALTYNMNILQGLSSDTPFCVTLNHTDAIDESRIIKRMEYDHPVFTQEGIAAQARHSEINGAKRTYYCGAYWRNGFHEDGVVSALDALRDFEEHVDAQLHIRRAS